MSTANPEAPAPPAASGWGSPLLAHVALVALVLFSIAQALEIFQPLIRANSRQQMVYVLAPNTNGSLQELQKLLDSGWRIIHVASDLSAISTPLQGGTAWHKDWYAYTVYVLER